MGGREWKMKNFKFQAPNSRETSTSNLQASRARSRFAIWNLMFLWNLGFGIWSFEVKSTALADENFTLSWTNNLLTISNSDLPSGKLDIWYLEAFCHKGSTHQDWRKTV